MQQNLINHVSDTAIWIAMYRALETERQDAVFKDPFAKRLAGERGKQIVASTPHSKAMEFAMVIRTAAIDRLIEKAVALGVDTIINLGAGLDTRPYRMKLPPTLRWIEVDFEHMIGYKNDQLFTEKPVCSLQRIATDLSVDEERKKLFENLGKETKKALILTEGVIGYLANDEAGRLSRDLVSVPSFRYWIQDFSQGKMRKNKQSRDVSKNLTSAPWQFDVDDPIGFFGKDGWKVNDTIYILDEAKRLGRTMPVMFPWSILMYLFPKKIHELGNKTYGYALFEKLHN